MEEFLCRHPMEWLDTEMSARGEEGDRAGITPTPAVREFLALCQAAPELFTHQQYTDHCVQQWDAWFSTLSLPRQRGVIAKLRNNFYPAMIDTLHAQALLVEACVFDFVLLDWQSDVKDKVDLILQKQNRILRLGLVGPSPRARANREFKLVHRPGKYDQHIITITMSWNRPTSRGNKRWFTTEDFSFLLTGDWNRLMQGIRDGEQSIE